jgi:SAM-dependent methyltransferase
MIIDLTGGPSTGNLKMPFMEHRGSGKSKHNINDMTAIWDQEWNASAAKPITQDHKAWLQMRDYLPKTGRILEAGCGVATWVKFLKDRGYEAHGIDFSPVAIQKSLDMWPELKLVWGDLREMPYDTGYFQAIVSFGAIEHDPSGPTEALREMLRVLEPGGIMYCSVPCMNTLRRCGTLALKDWFVRNKTIRRLFGRKPEVSFYEFVYSPEEYRRVLTEVGFEILLLLPHSLRLDFFDPPPGSFRRKILSRVCAAFPWLAAHMVVAICRKPARPD